MQRMKAAAIVFLATTGLICLVNLVSQDKEFSRGEQSTGAKAKAYLRGSGKWKIYEAV